MAVVFFACTGCSSLYEADGNTTASDIRCWDANCNGRAVRLPDNPRMKWMRDILDRHEKS